jgi:polyphosphate kinase
LRFDAERIMATVRPAPAPRVGRGRRRGPRDQRAPILNRELSWIEFNARVLHEARDVRNPLLERVKFLAIFASNLDEFFQVRVSGLRRQVQAGASPHNPDSMTPAQQLDAIRDRVRDLVAEHSAIWTQIHAELVAERVEILDYDAVPEHHENLRRRFHDEMFPVLTPLAVDPGHPFPYISTLSLSIAVGLRDPETGETRFARVKIPPILPRLVAVERDKFVLLDQVIEANLDELFRGMEILETHLFRVTRDADITVEEDEADDLLLAIEEEVRRRRFGQAVRLEVERSMPELTRQILVKGIGVLDEDSFEVAGMLDLTALWQLVDLDRPDLKAVPYVPVVPARLQPPDDDEPADLFAQIRAGDILLHHPYESFTASVERFVTQAANDPNVLTIKQTLYRTSGDSPIVQALIEAAGRGIQVVVLVEIKARFDEANNIIWARRLEQAGAHVVYGLVGLKTHSKVLLVVRREGSGLRRYVHIGTGNYNSKTARLYVDLGILSAREELGADVTDLFNTLTGLSRQRVFRRLLVAPITLRSRFLELIEREVVNARAGQDARIVLKVNSLVDTQIIEALYDASRAGVDVDVIARGACCIVPGVPGASERIRVRSIIGEFLEHSRIWMFANGGRPEWYIGSADIMERNLDRRVEVVTPVEDHGAQARLARIIEVMLADDRRSWQLQPDGRWLRTEVIESREGTVDTFATLKDDAASAARTPEDPSRSQTPAGSMDPRA